MIQGFSGGLLNRQLIYNLDLPSFQRDFAALKTLDHGTGPAITFTRASNATFFDANGVLQTASNDVPRFDHSQDGAANSLGLLIEESRTNSIRNSQAGGAANGVLGSATVPTPALPTNWGSAIPAGIAFEVMGSGTSGGLAYVDVKISGTNSSGSTVSPIISFENTTHIVASNTQTWTGSAYLALVAGSAAGASSFVLDIVERDSGGAFLAANSTGFTPTGTISRVSHTRTFNNASTARTNHRVAFSVANGNPIDLTLRIAAPQLEQGAFPTSYIPTTTAAATRSADSAVVTPISSFYNQSEGTLFADFTTGADLANARALVINQGSSNAECFFILSSTSGGSGSEFTMRSGGSDIYSLPSRITTVANTNFRIAGAYKSGDHAGSRNGAAAVGSNSATLPLAASLTRMSIGMEDAATNSLNGHIRKVAYWPKRLTNALLEQLTT